MGLKQLRKKIDSVDSDIIRLVSKRIRCVHDIFEYKKNNKIPKYDPKREKEIIKKARADAIKQRLDPDLAEKVIKVIIRYSRNMQK